MARVARSGDDGHVGARLMRETHDLLRRARVWHGDDQCSRLRDAAGQQKFAPRRAAPIDVDAFVASRRDEYNGVVYGDEGNVVTLEHFADQRAHAAKTDDDDTAGRHVAFGREMRELGLEFGRRLHPREARAEPPQRGNREHGQGCDDHGVGALAARQHARANRRGE